MRPASEGKGVLTHRQYVSAFNKSDRRTMKLILRAALLLPLLVASQARPSPHSAGSESLHVSS